jgi:hypothetical protein
MVHDGDLLGYSIEATAAQLMEESTKARENGERYAQMTAGKRRRSCRAPGAKPGMAANLSGAARASRVYMRENQRLATRDVPARLAHAHQRRQAASLEGRYPRFR